MNITVHKSQVHSIRQGDPDFNINDGFITYPRAMLHIPPECPGNIRDTINWAISKGYLKAVANITEREMLFIGLTK